MFLSIINLLFTIYTVMLMIRIFASWIPPLMQTRFMQMLRFYTDPYLNIFRKVVPPIGGVLDISPLFAFAVLQFFQYFIGFLFRWLW